MLTSVRRKEPIIKILAIILAIIYTLLKVNHKC